VNQIGSASNVGREALGTGLKLDGEWPVRAHMAARHTRENFFLTFIVSGISDRQALPPQFVRVAPDAKNPEPPGSEAGRPPELIRSGSRWIPSPAAAFPGRARSMKHRRAAR
jgi:hypothetical protein